MFPQEMPVIPPVKDMDERRRDETRRRLGQLSRKAELLEDRRQRKASVKREFFVSIAFFLWGCYETAAIVNRAASQWRASGSIPAWCSVVEFYTAWVLLLFLSLSLSSFSLSLFLSLFLSFFLSFKQHAYLPSSGAVHSRTLHVTY